MSNLITELASLQNISSSNVENKIETKRAFWKVTTTLISGKLSFRCSQLRQMNEGGHVVFRDRIIILKCLLPSIMTINFSMNHRLRINRMACINHVLVDIINTCTLMLLSLLNGLKSC